MGKQVGIELRFVMVVLLGEKLRDFATDNHLQRTVQTFDKPEELLPHFRRIISSMEEIAALLLFFYDTGNRFQIIVRDN